MAENELEKTPEPEQPTTETEKAEAPKQEEWKAQLTVLSQEKERLQRERDEALGELGDLKKTVSGQDRKITQLQRQMQTGSSEELKGLPAQVEALTQVLLADEDGGEERPLTKRERYEQLVKAKQPSRQPNPLEAVYATEIQDLFKAHSLDAESLPDDLHPAIERANAQWTAGAYELALKTMERAIGQRARKQEEAVKPKEEEQAARQKERETKATSLVRDRSSGAGPNSPDLNTLLNMPVHNMSNAELAQYREAVLGAIKKT